MDSKLKWAGSLCAALLCLGLYVDNKPPAPIDFKNPATFRYENILRHADRNVAAAQYVLGTFYQSGHPIDNIQPDAQKAQEWFKKAADNEHTIAAFEYARMVADEQPAQAEKYFRQAMAKGFAPALFALSQLKFKDGSPAALKEGLELVYASAVAKDPMGQAYLATLQHEGAGLKKDRVQAVLGMQLAAANAPTPETKKEWTEKHNRWFNELSHAEQEDLNEKLMLGSTTAPVGLDTPGSLPKKDLSSLLANLPVNGAKTMPK